MEYSHILALIDGYLDILHRARRILVQDSVPANAQSATRKRRPPMRSTVNQPANSSAQALEPEGIKSLPTEKPSRRKPRNVVQAEASTPSGRSLSAHVPLGPVVISPEQVRLQNAQRLAPKKVETHNQGVDIGEMPSAEMLLRRWKQEAARPAD